MEFSDIKKNAHIIMKDVYPCKIVEVNTSKTGKHGHAKKSVVGIDIITDKKHTELFTHSSQLKVPIISRQMFLVNYIDDDGYMELMDENNRPVNNIKLGDDEICEKIKNLYNNGDQINIIILFVEFNDNGNIKEQYRIIDYKLDN